MADEFSAMSKEELRNKLLENPHKRSILNVYKKKLSPLTELQHDIAIGLMLGDISLQTQDKGKTYRFKFEQGDKHKEYIHHLYSEFLDFCLTEPKSNTPINKYGNSVTSWTFQTISHFAFLPLADIFFKEKNSTTGKARKTITKDFVEKSLTPTAMAYWFMDDGGKMDYTKNEGKGIEFHCHSFSEEEVEYLVEGLQLKYNLNCWKKKNKGRHIVAVSGKCYSQMMDLIEKKVIPSLREKLPSPRREKKNEADDIV